MREVNGYEGIYKVSPNGDIWSEYRKRFLHPTLSRDGYMRVSLCKDGKRKLVSVHRIVASAYVDGETKEKAFVNHKDGNKLNNSVENLEWVTKGENLKHAYSELGAILAAKKTRCIDTGIVFISAADAGRKMGVNPTAIRQVLCGIKIKAGGYRWERA